MGIDCARCDTSPGMKACFSNPFDRPIQVLEGHYSQFPTILSSFFRQNQAAFLLRNMVVRGYILCDGSSCCTKGITPMAQKYARVSRMVDEFVDSFSSAVFEDEDDENREEQTDTD